MASGQYDSFVKQQLVKYSNRDQTQRDVMNVFSGFKDLRPKVDTHVFNDGSKKELLCIDGTIPVLYKGNTYNIPICIWVLETHPYNPPLCFVRPTSTMLIKPSKHVDANGRIYLPYLHDWKPNNSDLVGLIQVMSVVFGESSPVYAKSSQAPSRPNYPPQGPHAGMPQPGYPQPQQSSFVPMPTPGGSSTAYNQPQFPPTSSYQPPSATGYPQGGYGGSAGYPSSSSSSSSYQPYGQGQGQTPQTQSQPAFNPATTAANNAGSRPPVSNQSSVSDDAIKASLQSAVEDKLRRRLKENFDKFQAEMDSLTATKDKLKTGQRKLEEMINQLETETTEVQQNIHVLKQKDDEVKQALSKMEGRDELDMDDAVVPTAPLYKQLLNLFAEEMTIEDTYYYLMEGLKKDVVSIDDFTKNVRELSRKQFLLRAHIQKVRQTAGLREITPL